MKRKIAVRALVIDDEGKLFCVRLKAYDGKAEADYFCLPGGGIDPKESLEDALHREMIEETTVTPTVGELLYIQQYASDTEEQLEFFFHVTNTDDFKDLDISAASHADIEIAEFGFVDPKTTHVLPKFLVKEDILAHTQSKGPIKIFSYL